MPHIRDISNLRKPTKTRWYEVGVFYRINDENEIPEIVAKFKGKGDAFLYAQALKTRPDACSYTEIIVR